jgi:hypothetical protein
VCSSLGHRDSQARCAAAPCAARLAGGVPRRFRELKEVGMGTRLRAMRGNEDGGETREHVRRALAVFEEREM